MDSGVAELFVDRLNVKGIAGLARIDYGDLINRWGNGDVEVGLGELHELPYVMSLVRQSFEKQMGNGEVEA